MNRLTTGLEKMLQFRELSRKQIGSALFFFTLLFFIPVLFFGKIFMDGDTVVYTYPIAHFLKQHAGSVLNIFSLGGYPITPAFHIGYFNPLYQSFFKLFDVFFAYHLILFIDYLAAAFFTYAFVKSLGRSSYAALISTLAFVFGQWALFWMSSINIAHAVYLLPALLLCTLKITEGRKIYTLLFAALLGLAFTATHYQYIMLALIASGFFALFATYKNWQKSRGFFTNSTPLIFFTLAFILGLLIGLPQFLRTIDFFPYSTRSVFIVFQSVWYSDLLRYFLPSFELPRISTQEFLPYIGIIPLFLSIVALVKVRGERWGKYGIFFVWAFVFSLVLMLKYSPILPILKHLPFMQYFAQPARWLYIGNFSLAVLAAFGFDCAVSNLQLFESYRLRKFLKRFTYVALILTVIGNVVYALFSKTLLKIAYTYFDSNLYSKTIGLPIDYYHNLIEVTAHKLFSNISFANPHVVILFLCLFSILFLTRIKDKKVFSHGVLVFTALNMLLLGWFGFKLGAKDLLLEKPHFAKVIEQREKSPEDYRVFGYLIPFAQYQSILALHPEAHEQGFIFAREALVANLHLFSNISIVGGYEPIAPRRYQSLLFYAENAEAKAAPEDKMKKLTEKLSLLGMMNTKYIISPYEVSHPDLHLIEENKVTTYNVPLYLYENKKVLPRYYFARGVTFLQENNIDANFKTVTEHKGSFEQSTFIECDACDQISGTASQDTLTVLSRSSESVSFKTITKTPRWLIVSETFVPGWKATIDNVPATIHYANHAFQAVLVPVGEHKVNFSYSI